MVFLVFLCRSTRGVCIMCLCIRLVLTAREEDNGKKDLIQPCGMKELGNCFECIMSQLHPQQTAKIPIHVRDLMEHMPPLARIRKTPSHTFLCRTHGHPPLRSRQSCLCLLVLCTLV